MAARGGAYAVIWHVWTDGSCIHGATPEERANAPKGARGYGGWAAIIEHGSDGLVLRGRKTATTNVRMELLAALEGLKKVPAGARAILHTDATTLVSVYVRWTDGALADNRSRTDDDLWQKIGGEFSRLVVGIDLLGRGTRDPIHRRAHAIAGAEARAALGELPENATPLLDLDAVRRERRKRSAATASTGRPTTQTGRIAAAFYDVLRG